MFVATWLIGCRPAEKSDGSNPATASPAETAELGNRLEVIARSNELALEAQRAPEPQAAELLRRAASLRERLYRLERRPVDALEAIELLSLLERPPKQDCDAGRRRILLDGELNRDPVRVYQNLYALKQEHKDPSCVARIERALIGLAGYRPLPGVLSQIARDRRTAGRATEPSPTRAARVSASASSVGASSASFEGPATISRVERYGADDATRVVIFVSRPVRFEVGELRGGARQDRLFVDIEGATSEGTASYDVEGLVERVRLGNHERGARVALDLRRPAEARVFYLPEPFRLVIDVYAGTRRGAPRSGKRRVTRVVLDPGHGGHDPGAVGRTGLREKDVTLDIAHRAAPLIARELGVTTLLTRDGDYYVPLDARTARANAFQADLFISIHCNASEDTLAQGVTTFILDQGREQLSTRLAARENAASLAAAEELASVLSRISDPRNRGPSLAFAGLLQRAATASLAKSYPDTPDGGVRRAGFYVLAGARMPAVLFETSFISSETEETRLNTEDFRQKMADSIVNAIRAYRDGH